MAEKFSVFLPLLKKIAVENNFKTYDIKVKPISSGGANYSSVLYVATISGDGHDDLRLFLKQAVMGEKIREQWEGNPFDNERFIYTDVMAAYRKLEDKHGVSEEHRLRYPKYYGADTTYLREVIVLEDLACQGYILHDRMKPVDWEYASAAITQLARFHALSFALELQNPEEFKAVLPRFLETQLLKENEGSLTFFATGVKTALSAVREENRDLLRSFFEQYSIIDYANMYHTKRRPVLIHGDFRPSNMLHRPRKDGTVELILVDYQTLQFGSPVTDLLYFIYMATDGSARARFYDKMVSHYYSELDSALHRFGLRAADVYPEGDFRDELKEKESFGLLLSSLMLPLLLVPEEDAPKMDGDIDMSFLSVTVSGDLHKKRLNEVVDEYIKRGLL